MPIVLLIRHAQASYGTADYDVLSETGHEQVDALKRALMRRGIVADRVVTGSLRRQRDSGSPWSDGARLACTVDERWNEFDDDDVLTHHSNVQVRMQRSQTDAGPALSSRDFQVILDQALGQWVSAGAESQCAQPWPAFLTQINRALDEFAASLLKGQTGLAFSSSGVIAALAASLIGDTDRAFVSLNRVSVNTAITKVVVGRQGRTLVSYNDHSHLEETGRDLVTYR